MDINDLMKKQLFWTRLIAAVCVLALVLMGGLLISLKLQVDRLEPQLTEIVNRLDNSTAELEEFSSRLNQVDLLDLTENAQIIAGELAMVQWQDIAGNLQEVARELSDVDWEQVSDQLTGVSTQLSDIDWPSLAANIDEMAVTAQTSMEKAMEAIDQLDVEELNEAISQLHTVIEPLAAVVEKLQGFGGVS